MNSPFNGYRSLSRQSPSRFHRADIQLDDMPPSRHSLGRYFSKTSNFINISIRDPSKSTPLTIDGTVSFLTSRPYSTSVFWMIYFMDHRIAIYIRRLFSVRCVSCRHRATQLFVRQVSAMSKSSVSERPSQLKDTMLAAGPEKDPCF